MAVMLKQLTHWTAARHGREETVPRAPVRALGSPIYEALMNEWSRAGRTVPGESDPPRGYSAVPVPVPVVPGSAPRRTPDRGRPAGRGGAPAGDRTPDGQAPEHGQAAEHAPAPAPDQGQDHGPDQAEAGAAPPGSSATSPPSPPHGARPVCGVQQISPTGPAEPVSPREPAWERVGTL